MRYSTKYCVGSVFTNAHGETCEVIKNIDHRFAEVKFSGEFPHTKVVWKSQLGTLGFRSDFARTVYGVGIYVPYGVYICRDSVSGKITKEYNLWSNMLKRCYCPQQLEEDPTYKGMSVHKEWERSDVYWKWAERQAGWLSKNYHQDKDLLVPGNKVYSPDTVVFISNQLNTFLCDCRKVRSQYGQGVYKKGKKFSAVMWDNNKPTNLGVFDTLEDASNTFCKAKTEVGRRWGQRLKAGEFEVDPRVTERMLNFVWEPVPREDVYANSN